MNLTDLSQFFFSGLTIGCIYALVALGFVIIANVTQVYNFAQGEYVMIGAMVVAGGTEPRLEPRRARAHSPRSSWARWRSCRNA